MKAIKWIMVVLCFFILGDIQAQAEDDFAREPGQSVDVALVPYPEMRANSSSYEWIEELKIGNLNHRSGNDNGYGNFTSMSADFPMDSPIAVNLVPGFSYGNYMEYWSIWIDYNYDGDFADPGENVFNGSGNGNVSGNFTVPSTSVAGPTRMRVAMRYNSAPPSTGAGIFDYGEVEDYGINIVGTGPSPGIVEFPDMNLEEVIRAAINKPAGDIYAEDLVFLTSLDAGYRGITNLSGIEHCKNLTFLKLIFNSITDISPLQHLAKLETLFLCYNYTISDLTPIAGLTALTRFEATGNNISNIKPLRGLSVLERVELDKNNISDIQPLQSLTKLYWIDLNNNQVRDLTPLKDHIAITMLDIESNNMDLRSSTPQGIVNLDIVDGLLSAGAQVKYFTGNIVQ